MAQTSTLPPLFLFTVKGRADMCMSLNSKA